MSALCTQSDKQLIECDVWISILCNPFVSLVASVRQVEFIQGNSRELCISHLDIILSPTYIKISHQSHPYHWTLRESVQNHAWP